MSTGNAVAWSHERREFSLASHEEALDAREAALDLREQQLDERLAELGDLDDQARQRQEARAERARRRQQRAQDRRNRDADIEEHLNPEDYPLAAQFAELATHLYAAKSYDGVLEHLVKITSQVISNVDGVSVTVHTDNEPQTSAASDDFAEKMDRMQYDHAEGPCLDAVATPGLAYATCADLNKDNSWPTFAPAASRAGCASVLSLGMFPETTESLPRLGSLNVYSTVPDAFTEQDRMAGMLLAAHGAVAMASTTTLDEAHQQTQQLHQGMLSRDVIGQAKGILMERQKITPEQAFDLLRDASNRLNTKLVEVAEMLAHTGEAPTPRQRSNGAPSTNAPAD